MVMTTNKPYIIRAMYEWIVDNNCTPYVLVDSNWPGLMLPTQFIAEDKIVLNISPVAVRGLNTTNESISFVARFNNQTLTVDIPVSAVQAIYAQENGQGMVFDPEPYPEEASKQSSILNIVSQQEKDTKKSELDPESEISSEDNEKPSKKGKPSLKIIK